MEIRQLTADHELQAYQDLCKYCFPNVNNWIDHLLPILPGNVVFGLFQQEHLQAGLISNAFVANVFGQKVKLSGIGAVTSAPEGRNVGYVRQLMQHALQHECERGLLVSALYPFLFQFYEKMGYGYAGGLRSYTFKPDDLRPFPIRGEFRPVISDQDAAAFIQIHHHVVQQYELGLELPHDAHTYRERLQTFGSYAYLYQTTQGIRGYLEYRFLPETNFSRKLQIARFGFLDREAFQAGLAFIRSHRNQCSEVVLSVPDSLRLCQVFQEPRVKTEVFANWMVRPLDVEAVLRLRLACDPVEHPIALTVTDPLLAQNTGTYHLQGTQVVKTEPTGEHPLPFEVFSALLFQAITFDQAAYAGKIDWQDRDIAAYFSKLGDIYLSNFF